MAKSAAGLGGEALGIGSGLRAMAVEGRSDMKAISGRAGLGPGVWRPGLAVSWVILGFLFGAGCMELAASSQTSGQGGVRFVIDSWDTDEGLPPSSQNSVTSILQARDGFLWFGTLNGLVRFDGLEFVVFDESNTPGLGSSRVVALFEDRKGDLWIGTETAGVVRMSGGKYTSVGVGQGRSDCRMVSACQDRSGGIWFCMADGQLWRMAEERYSVFVLGLDRPSSYRGVVADAEGPVWVGADDRLVSVRPFPVPGGLEPQVEVEVAVGKLDRLVASGGGGYWRLADGVVQRWRGGQLDRDWGAYPWGRVPVSAAAEDGQGNLVVGTLGGGVFWYDGQGKATRISLGDHPAFNIVLSLCIDRDGTLWVGTDGRGLCRVRRQVFEVWDLSWGVSLDVVQSVSADDRGGIWIGSNGGGVTHWREGEMRQYGSAEGLTNRHVWAVHADRGGRVWAGTWGDGLFCLAGERFERPPGAEVLPRVIRAIYEDAGGRLWLGTQGGLAVWEGSAWRVYTQKDGLSSDEVRALAEDGVGGMWVGTGGGGVNRFRGGRFEAIRRGDGLPADEVTSLLAEAGGVLWVGTRGGGLGRYAGGRWTRYTTREGLLSNSVGYLLDDELGHLWVGSTAGLMRIKKAELEAVAGRGAGVVTCRAYGKPDGLPTRECTAGSQPGAARGGDGRLWFPTARGLAAVQPSRLNPNPRPPPVRIEEVLVNGQPQVWEAGGDGGPPVLRVSAGKEHLEIRYTSLNLAAADRGRFKYRLDAEGDETTWTEAGTDRVARYPRLPPGEYRFHVQASNEDGLWNEVGSVLRLVVEPPFWRTWWFVGGVVVVLLGAVTGTVHTLSTQRLRRQVERLRQEEALEKERARIARDIHDHLGACLTQVALLGELVEGDKEDPAEVEVHARQISQTARDTTRVLDEIVWALNPSNDTVESLITYASKYAQEYLSTAGLRCRLDVPGVVPAAVLPPEVRHNVFLALKEAVTNVVRHAGASAVWVRVRFETGAFAVEVEDNGRGLGSVDPAAARLRNGLSNMRRRMEEVGGRFELGSAADGGTRVRLVAPLVSWHGGAGRGRASVDGPAGRSAS